MLLDARALLFAAYTAKCSLVTATQPGPTCQVPVVSQEGLRFVGPAVPTVDLPGTICRQPATAPPRKTKPKRRPISPPQDSF